MCVCVPKYVITIVVFLALLLTLYVAMCPDAPYFIILLYLTPDDFTHQGESVATQWVNMRFLIVLLTIPSGVDL
jgi:hypothetical protein